LYGAGGDDDGAAGGAELFGKFAETAAHFVVVAIARKVFEKKDGIALDRGDVGESGFWRFGIVDGCAVEAGEADGDAPGEERDAEVGGDFDEELLSAILFGGFDGEDGMAGIDEQAEFVAPGGVGGGLVPRRGPIGVVRIEFGGRVHGN